MLAKLVAQWFDRIWRLGISKKLGISTKEKCMYRQRLGWMVVVCFVLLLSTLSAQAPMSQAQGLPTPTPTPVMCNGLPATYFEVGDGIKFRGGLTNAVIVMIGSGNTVSTGGGTQTICMIGDKNSADGGRGNDFISFTGDKNKGDGGSDTDTCVATPVSTNKFINCEPNP